jgi:hypothetical protein
MMIARSTDCVPDRSPVFACVEMGIFLPEEARD